MCNRTRIPLRFLAILICTSCSSTTLTPFWETQDAGLADLAMVRADPHWGTVVIYNPVYCAQIGDACVFFRAHAFAHVRLNHTLLASPAHYPDLQEAQADCYAAQRSDPRINTAVVEFLLQADVAALEWKLYGDPTKRAQNIRACAIKAGRWTGGG